MGLLFIALSTLFTLVLLNRVKSQCPSQCSCSGQPQYYCIKCAERELSTVPKNLPMEMFQLDLSINPMLTIPDNVFKNRSINILDLNNCGIRKPFALPFNIDTLNLDGNYLTTEHIRKMFARPFKSILTLTLEFNNLRFDEYAHPFDNASSLVTLRLEGNSIPFVSSRLLSKLRNLDGLRLRSCQVREIVHNAFRYNTFLRILDLSNNNLAVLPFNLLSYNHQLSELNLRENRLKTVPLLPKGVFLNIYDLSHNDLNDEKEFSSVKASGLLLGYNKLTTMPKLWKGTFMVDLAHNLITSVYIHSVESPLRLKVLNLVNNNITHLDRYAFSNLPQIHSIYLSNNKLQNLHGELFASSNDLKYVLLDRNLFRKVPSALKQLPTNLEVLTLFGNLISEISDDQGQSISVNTKVYIDCDILSSISLTKGKVACSTSEQIELKGIEANLASSLREMGFECQARGTLFSTSCRSCAVGYFNDGKESCQPCYQGGYFQNKPAQRECKRCNPGQFVNTTGGKSPLDCKTCSIGTDPDKYADTRACYCLPGFARRNRFGPCFACRDMGLVCKHGYTEVASGYWWKWLDSQVEQKYLCFRKNLLTNGLDYNRHCSSFYDELPKIYKCPYPKACLGGVKSKCHKNYTGPLCAACSMNYYHTYLGCVQCPQLLTSILKFLTMPLLMCFLFLIISFTEQVGFHNNAERNLADVILSITKIFLAHWQILIVITHLLSSIEWPKILTSIVSSVYLVLFEVFSFPVLKCIHQSLEITAYHEMLICTTGFTMFPIFMIVLYAIHFRIRKSRCRYDCDLELLKNYYMRNTVLVLFIAYPYICKRIFQVLPMACRTLCLDTNRLNCVSYLSSDYRERCAKSDPSKQMFLTTAYFACSFPIGLPVCLLLMLWHSKRKQMALGIDAAKNNAFCFATRFCSESYKEAFWYWELVELLRKLLFTVGFAFFGLEARTTLGSMIVITGTFAVLYAYFKPMKYSTEHHLQLLSTATLFLTLCMGVVLSTVAIGGRNYRRFEQDRLGITIILSLLNGGMLFYVFVLFFAYLVRTCFLKYRERESGSVKQISKLFAHVK